MKYIPYLDNLVLVNPEPTTRTILFIVRTIISLVIFISNQFKRAKDRTMAVKIDAKARHWQFGEVVTSTKRFAAFKVRDRFYSTEEPPGEVKMDAFFSGKDIKVLKTESDLGLIGD